MYKKQKIYYNPKIKNNKTKEKKNFLWGFLYLSIILAVIIMFSMFLNIKMLYTNINEINKVQEQAYQMGYDQAAKDMMLTIVSQVKELGVVQLNYPVNKTNMGTITLIKYEEEK